MVNPMQKLLFLLRILHNLVLRLLPSAVHSDQEVGLESENMIGYFTCEAIDYITFSLKSPPTALSPFI